MTIKLTATRVASLLETLNALICEEGLLTAEQRQPMVMTVATIGALGERVRLAVEEKEARKAAKAARAEKKPREPDPVFPRSGTPWTDDDDSLLDTLIEDVPDEEIDHQMHWLSGKLGRTPYAIALRIVSRGRLDDEWPKTFRPMALTIREEFAAAAAETEPVQEERYCTECEKNQLQKIIHATADGKEYYCSACGCTNTFSTDPNSLLKE